MRVSAFGGVLAERRERLNVITDHGTAMQGRDPSYILDG